MTSDRLFVYGTLMRGFDHPMAQLLSRSAEFIGEARGLVNTGIEIRQDLIADQSGQQQWAERLARIFGEIETELKAERLA